MNNQEEENAVSKPGSVWKVGSRWSYDGNAGSSILDIFRRHNVVFSNANHDRFHQINPGDLIAVSDGKVIVALGRVNSRVTTLNELNLPFTEQESGRVDPNEPVPAVRLSFIDLKEEDFIDYRIGAIHRVHERAEQLIELYQSYDNRYKEEQGFEINARSCTLLANSSKPEEVLWKDRSHFQVPVYQRSYSWGETEIRRLLSDLLTAFWGRLGRAPQEAMFIGTMQLSAAVKRDNTDAQIQEIIDGQQRCTTLILTLKALQLMTPNAPIWKKIDYRNRLSTTVNGGIQQNYLEQALDSDCSEEVPDELNAYQKGLKIIFEELSQEEDWQGDEGQIESFVNYLISSVYFVVIETRATLSKTLQIFDA
ncbi:MAG: DUF262 domain-containing protein, partial [Candidatus Marinimicrobia bacterium]|nr:DUF262 domain-containing protein [Candidatus Neomarinimicrobiota bacterium]